MKRLTFFLPLTLLFFAVFPQYEVVNAKDTWTSVQSKNFFLIGNGSEKDIRQVAVRLEQFRDVFIRLFPRMKFTTPVPTTVVVFKSESSFKPFKPGPNLAGYFQPGQDVNYIAMTTELTGAQDPFNVIFHEYTHLLVDNTIENAPIWFNEGLAEYYSTFKINEDQKFVLGDPIGNHVLLLRESKMLPLRTLFEVDHKSPHYNERDKQSIFYAESWALMHYLIIGKPGRLEQLAIFLDRLMSQVPTEKAFQEAFRMDFEAMEKELREYVRQSRYNILNGHFERKLETDTSMKTAPVSEAEAQAYLGDLLLHSYRKECETYLEKALSLDPNSLVANAAMGMAKLRDGKPSEALVNLERAVAANSQNYLTHYYYASALSKLGSKDTQPVTGYAPGVAEKIRQEALKAIELRPDFPGSYSLLGYVSLVSGNNVDEALTLVSRAVKAAPGRNDLVFILGQLYGRQGDYKTAKQLLEQVARSSAEEDLKRDAEHLLNELATYQQQLEKYQQSRRTPPPPNPAGPKSTNTTIVVTGDQPTAPPQDPSSYLREALRKPANGETQVQGNLLKVECDAKGLFFVVKVGDQLLRLHCKKFEEIELTTYNPSVQGDISCGPRKSEDAVVICFAPVTDKRLKANGTLKSIEFVPANFKLKS
jgi:tetratricopeptide (TPR) repeat protein